MVLGTLFCLNTDKLFQNQMNIVDKANVKQSQHPLRLLKYWLIAR